MQPFIYGLTVSFSLILAIGAQNAFVLKQGLKGHHIFWVCLVCALSDSLLMALGVAGFSKIITHYPMIVTLAKYFGAAFLFVYGALSFKKAFTMHDALNPSVVEEVSLVRVITICLAFTWLNPHVYLDTLVLIGSISTQFKGNALHFALGAITASWLFFFALGYGARILKPIFENPKAWNVLEFIIGVIMFSIASALLF